jgi:hypothetical protein
MLSVEQMVLALACDPAQDIASLMGRTTKDVAKKPFNGLVSALSVSYL